MKDLKPAIESILYVLDEPLKVERLYEFFEETENEEIDKAVEVLREEYAREDCGLMLREVGEGLLLSTRFEYDEYVREFLKIKKRSYLSRQALEALAIIAYEQPITAPEIREIRGADPSGVIRTLLQRKLIQIAGRKEVIGRPFMYTTSTDFLIYFGLNSLNDLPKPEEFVNLLADEEERLNMMNRPEKSEEEKQEFLEEELSEENNTQDE